VITSSLHYRFLITQGLLPGNCYMLAVIVFAPLPALVRLSDIYTRVKHAYNSHRMYIFDPVGPRVSTVRACTHDTALAQLYIVLAPLSTVDVDSMC
jgi:uncharacterized membrane protein